MSTSTTTRSVIAIGTLGLLGAWSSIALIVLAVSGYNHVSPYLVFGVLQGGLFLVARRYLKRYLATMTIFTILWFAATLPIGFVFDSEYREFDVGRAKSAFGELRASASEAYARTRDCGQVAEQLSDALTGQVGGRMADGRCLLYHYGFDRDDDKGSAADLSTGFLSPDALPWSKIPLPCLAMTISGGQCSTDGDIDLGWLE